MSPVALSVNADVGDVVEPLSRDIEHFPCLDQHLRYQRLPDVVGTHDYKNVYKYRAQLDTQTLHRYTNSYKSGYKYGYKTDTLNLHVRSTDTNT